MKLKIITLLIFILCFSFGQESIKNTNAFIDTTTNNIVGDEFDDLKSDIEKLSKMISAFDKKFEQLDTSLSGINEELNSQVNSFNSSYKKLKDELTSDINSISDSLINNANRILNIRNEKSFNDAFLKARLEKGKNEEFVWNGKVFNTNYPDESKTPTIILEIEGLRDNLKSRIENLDVDIEKVSKKGENDFSTIVQTIKDRTLYWIIAILIVLIIVISIFFFLKSQVVKQQGTLSSVEDAQDKLEKEAIKLDEKTLDLIENQLSVMKLQPESSKAVDHSFTIAVANEIQRIRNRLKYMNQDEQATKVIRKRVESLEDLIKENSYELIQLEGKPYNKGMTIQAQFVPDETLKKGDRIISRVIKPQINFDGKLIQVAEVQVSQGI
jgi:hypothetical protein|tara:strand:+ start:680 stop:1831 length:1152 start_codon:yes stop_codon:yes gene_type:complete